MNTERKSSILILFACFLWALDLLVRYPVTLKLSFVTIVLLESIVGLLFVMPWTLSSLQDLKKLTLKDWLAAMFIGGVGMSVAGYLQNACIQKATPGLFSFFQIFQPLLVIYLAHRILKNKIENMYLYWGIWGVLSAILMFSTDIELMLESEIIFSDILIALTTMIIWSLCTILSKKFLEHHSVKILVTLRWVFAFLFSLIILTLEGETASLEALRDSDLVFRFIYMGLVSGIFAMYLYYLGMKEIEAPKVSFVEISYSAFGLILSALYTFEGLTFFQLIGAASFFAFLILFLTKQESFLPAVKTR